MTDKNKEVEQHNRFKEWEKYNHEKVKEIVVQVDKSKEIAA
jgi:hypothetical protein